MTLLNPPAYLQGGTYTALLDRQHLVTARNYKDTADNARARSGLLPDTMAWSAAISAVGFSITIGPFRAIVANSFATSAGDYEVVSVGNDTRAQTGSSPTTNRIDIIGVRVFDAFYAGAVNQADVVIIQGTATAGTPADPVLPASFLPFYRLTVSASSTTPVVTDMRRRTAPVGAVCPIFATQIAEGGSYIGEKRIVPASGILPMREQYWGADLAWHGSQTISLRAPNFATGVFTTSTLLSTLNIPDPGYAYNVVMSGAAWARNTTSPGGWWVKCYNGAPGGGQTVSVPGVIRNYTEIVSVPICGGSENNLTGASSIQVWTEPPFGGAGVDISSESKLTVMVVPV
jgi:hypothetical protein